MTISAGEAFIKIWHMSTDPHHETAESLRQFIPPAWRTILMSDGSFTRNAAILGKQEINIELIEQEESFSSDIANSIPSKQRLKVQHEEKITRLVWLISKEKKKLRLRNLTE